MQRRCISINEIFYINQSPKINVHANVHPVETDNVHAAFSALPLEIASVGATAGLIVGDAGNVSVSFTEGVSTEETVISASVAALAVGARSIVSIETKKFK